MPVKWQGHNHTLKCKVVECRCHCRSAGPGVSILLQFTCPWTWRGNHIHTDEVMFVIWSKLKGCCNSFALLFCFFVCWCVVGLLVLVGFIFILFYFSKKKPTLALLCIEMRTSCPLQEQIGQRLICTNSVEPWSRVVATTSSWIKKVYWSPKQLFHFISESVQSSVFYSKKI